MNKNKITILLLILLSASILKAQERYTDFSKALNDYKLGKIGVERFPLSGDYYTSKYEFEMYSKDVKSDYIGLFQQKLESMINYGNGGIVFKYDFSVTEQGDFLVPQTTFTGPILPTETKTMDGVQYKVKMKLNPNDVLPDSLYIGKISVLTLDNNSHSALIDFMGGVYKHKHKAGDRVPLGSLKLLARIDFSSSDTIWAYDMSKSGYPDYSSIRESHHADSLKLKSYWSRVITKEDFKRKYLYPKQEGGDVILEKKHVLEMRADETDSTILRWDIVWSKDDEFDWYWFLFKDQSKPAFKSGNNWYSAVGRDIAVLYDIFIHNNKAQCEKERLIAENQKKEAERLELEKANEKQELAKKYGQKYVDALYDLKIIVGMPEDLVNVLVNKLYTVGSTSSSSNGDYYRLDARYGTGWVSVWIKNKVVTAVTYH